MSIQNKIVNGGFETGSFPPWSATGASITGLFSHSGSFAASFP
ncbi:hypothetical protein [Metabacillus indicus]|nr:hypothetical protein [Metabacillus indicus]